MAYGDRTNCKACGREIVQSSGGHRQRQYCDDNCRQDAFRKRQEEKRREGIRQCWADFRHETQEYLDFLMTHYGEELASGVADVLTRELADHRRMTTIAAGTDEQLMEYGRRLGFPEYGLKLANGQTGKIPAGEQAWRHFSEVAEMRLVRSALESIKRNAPSE